MVLGEIHNDRHRRRIFVSGHERTTNPLNVTRQLLRHIRDAFQLCWQRLTTLPLTT